MNDAQMSNDWQSAISTSYEQLVTQLVTYVPQLIGAAILILIGWLVAWVLSKLTVTFLNLCNRLLSGVNQRIQTDKALKIKPKQTRFISRTVFWLTMMFFIAAATSSMGLDFFSEWISSLLSYLPNLLAGILIMLGGYLLGNLAGAMARAGAQSVGFAGVELAGRSAKLAILFTALVIGVEQLGINIQFVTSMVIVLSGVLCFGIALAFGLGSKDLIANTVAARQIHRHCRVNDQIEIAGVTGKLTEVTSTMLVIETDKGRTLLPANLFLKQPSYVSALQTSEQKD